MNKAKSAKLFSEGLEAKLKARAAKDFAAAKNDPAAKALVDNLNRNAGPAKPEPLLKPAKR